MGAEKGCITLQGPLCGPLYSIEPLMEHLPTITTRSSAECHGMPYPLEIHWDNISSALTAEADRLHFLPVASYLIRGANPGRSFCMSGLILKPTFIQKGQFERMGYAESHPLSVEENWSKAKESRSISPELYIDCDKDSGFQIEII